MNENSYNSNKITRIRDLVFKILEKDELIVNKPLLFASDYFYSIRNEIDIEAETLLLKCDNDSSKLDEINRIRDSIINEINSYEIECFSKLKQLGEQQKQAFDETKSAFYKHKQTIEEVLEKAMRECDSIEGLDDLESRAIELLYEIRKDLNGFKSFLFNQKTLIFKKSYLNDLGILIVFESIYMDESETEVLK